MTGFENVGVFIREKFWLEPNLFPYKYSNILKPSHSSYLSAYGDGTECSETSAYKTQTPGNYPEESVQHSEHGESLKSRLIQYCFYYVSAAILSFKTLINLLKFIEVLRKHNHIEALTHISSVPTLRSSSHLLIELLRDLWPFVFGEGITKCPNELYNKFTKYTSAQQIFIGAFRLHD